MKQPLAFVTVVYWRNAIGAQFLQKSTVLKNWKDSWRTSSLESVILSSHYGCTLQGNPAARDWFCLRPREQERRELSQNFRLKL